MTSDEILAIHPAWETQLLLTQPRSVWRGTVQARLEHLVRLPRGWDGYDGKPVRFDIAVFALSLLDRLLGPAVVAPAIVPGADGDLQIEWHVGDIDIELHVIHPNVVHAFASDDPRSDGCEMDLRADFGPLAPWIARLPSESVDAAAPAAA